MSGSGSDASSLWSSDDNWRRGNVFPGKKTTSNKKIS